MKRIVMFEGGVETLAYFSHQMAEQFRDMGYLVFFYDLKQEEYSAKKLRKFLRMGETVLITFNFQGLEKEAGVYKAGIGYIWDTYQIPCYNIVADHPYFYHERLKDLPKKYHHISIDRRHEAYMKRFYPEILHEGFLPLAGTKLCAGKQTKAAQVQEKPAASDGNGQFVADEKAAAERPYDVILTGNYTRLSFFEPYINWINDEYAAFYRGIIEDLLAHPYLTVEEAALAHCEREMGREPDDALRIALSKMIFIDLYVRNYWRGKAVRTLVNAGISVEVVGKGWEELEDISCPQRLHIHPQTDSKTCLLLIQQSKVSLNVMPWFKDGAHDRVFNSILNGAVCLTDTSGYLCESLKEGEGVCFYELEQIEELPMRVKSLLQEENQRQEVVSRGEEKVRNMHTWAQRAVQLEKWLSCCQ